MLFGNIKSWEKRSKQKYLPETNKNIHKIHDNIFGVQFMTSII